MVYLVNYYAYDPTNGNKHGYVAFEVFSSLEGAERGIEKAWSDKRYTLSKAEIGNVLEYCGGEFGELFAKIFMTQVKDCL